MHTHEIKIPSEWKTEIRDRKGKLIAPFEFEILYQDPHYKILSQDKIDEEYMISTVWLGVEYFSGLFFETTVFKKKDPKTQKECSLGNWNWDDIITERYHSEDEAFKGHEEVMKKAKEIIDKGLELTYEEYSK